MRKGIQLAVFVACGVILTSCDSPAREREVPETKCVFIETEGYPWRLIRCENSEVVCYMSVGAQGISCNNKR